MSEEHKRSSCCSRNTHRVVLGCGEGATISIEKGTIKESSQNEF